MARYRGKGTQLWVETVPDTFEKVPQCFQGQGGDASTPQVDVTDFDSEGKEFEAGETDYGATSWQMYWDAANSVQRFLEVAQELGTKFRARTIFTQYTPNIQYEYEATVQSFTPDYGTNDTFQQVALVLKISGAPVYSTL
ncbi:MAG: phage tail tube protein [Pseudomonadota bacterium]